MSLMRLAKKKMLSTTVSLSAWNRCADTIRSFCRDKRVPQFRDLSRKASSSTRKRAMGNTTLGDAVLDICFSAAVSRILIHIP